MSAAVSMAGCVSLSSMAATFVSLSSMATFVLAASSMFKRTLSLSLAMTMSVGALGRFKAEMRYSVSHLIQMWHWLASMVALVCASRRCSSCALSEGVEVKSIGSIVVTRAKARSQ